MEDVRSDSDDGWIQSLQSRLRPAFVARLGPQGADDALSVALSYAWEHRERVEGMDNPHGYLYRLGVRSTFRQPRRIALPAPTNGVLPEMEPRLPEVLSTLSSSQRVAVILVYGLGWTAREVAELQGTSVSSVETHLQRGLKHLRKQLGVFDE
jgi:DNA-directed RNA polymerase specialized sigma24 family protein